MADDLEHGTLTFLDLHGLLYNPLILQFDIKCFLQDLLRYLVIQRRLLQLLIVFALPTSLFSEKTGMFRLQLLESLPLEIHLLPKLEVFGGNSLLVQGLLSVGGDIWLLRGANFCLQFFVMTHVLEIGRAPGDN